MEIEKSKGKGKHKEIEKTVRIVKNALGDPRFLQVVFACVTKRCALQGLDAPAKVEIDTWEIRIVKATEEHARELAFGEN